MNAVASRNVKFISHSDQGGRGDGVQIMVHRGYAYIGHGYSNGITVIDVRDPKNPETCCLYALSAQHPRHPSADPRRLAARRQRTEHVDDAGRRAGLLLGIASRSPEGQAIHRRRPRLRHLAS